MASYQGLRVSLPYTGEFPVTVNHTQFEPGPHKLTVIANSTTGQVAEEIVISFNVNCKI